MPVRTIQPSENQLPEKYYLSHAVELFDFVENKCNSLLDQQHIEYLSTFSSLSENSKCLLVRFLTRKPRFLKRNSLHYTEIENIESSIEELIKAGMIRTVGSNDWSSFLPILTKVEILDCLKSSGLQAKASANKASLLEVARYHLVGNEPQLRPIRHNYLLRCRQRTIDYILFVFFGDLNNRFQKFAMRDLGVLKTRSNKPRMRPRFSNRCDAQHVFTLLLNKRKFRNDPDKYQTELANYLIREKQIPKVALTIRQKLVLEVGNHLVINNPRMAIDVWRSSNDSKATERWVRESYKSQDRQILKQELQDLRSRALPAAQRVFIEDFYARKYEGQRTSIYTKMLNEADCLIYLDESFINDVEYGVVEHYQQQGHQAYFTENQHWRALFGLTFWELLYGEFQVQNNEFDLVPAQLSDGSFYEKQKPQIHSTLKIFSSPERAIYQITKLVTRQYGLANGLFRWSDQLLDSILPCVQFAPMGSIAKVLLSIAKDYQNSKDGYPDLMILENNQLRFEEVKSPGDSLRANQLLSINRLRSAGFEVNLTQVKWATNPHQVYAVVDIETTGTSKDSSAITEIAVVRVRGGKIISEWSSLVNPMRNIPPHISRLTGITNQMVSSAPIFEEIAQELREQLNQAIFVAHNVGFDYGFIKSAYHRKGERFRMPRYCTVVNSRKTFPRLKSYSLGYLTKYFNIDLDNHHRALSDARATADLLCMIHETKMNDK